MPVRGQPAAPAWWVSASDLCKRMPVWISATMLAMAQLGFLAGRSWKLHSPQQGVLAASQLLAGISKTFTC